MPRYLMLLVEDFDEYPDDDGTVYADIMAAHRSFNDAVATAGARVVEGEALHPVATATFLRGTRTPDVRVVDNPTPDLKEALGGYYLVEAADDAQALELAKQCPAGDGYVAVRKVWDVPG